ncbi:MAG: FkbM family methyltransferase [Candidatus Dormibacteria bacterium]
MIQTATRINGRWELILPSHRAMRPEWETGWETERLDMMHATIRPGDVVYDVGSEEADLSALYAMWAGPDGGVVLIEPNELVWGNALWIWEANHLSPPIGCVAGFAGPRDTADGQRDTAADGWPSCAHGPLIPDHGFVQLAERPDIAVVRLDTLAQRFPPPDVVSIDVEGAEWEVLKGATGLLGGSRPIFFVSVHPEPMRLYGHAPDDLYAFMDSFGYQRLHIATDHERHEVFWHPLGRAPALR